MPTPSHRRLLTAARRLVAFLDWREGDPLCTEMAEDATERGLTSDQYRADLVEATRKAIQADDDARVFPRGEVIARFQVGAEAIDDGLGGVASPDGERL